MSSVEAVERSGDRSTTGMETVPQRGDGDGVLADGTGRREVFVRETPIYRIWRSAIFFR